MHHRSLLFIGLLIVTVLGFVLIDRSRDAASAPPLALPTNEVLLESGTVYELTAGYVTKIVAGKPMRMLAYNGMIPGPTLRVAQGAEVTIRFKNNTDMATLLHSHGVRMENAYDGTHLVQADVLPGEKFDYRLKFEDAGAFWYHPHVREDKQQNLGLYGNFVVTPADSDFWAPADGEHTLFFSDVLIEGGDIAPYSDDYVTHALMGRFGNTLLVNGDVSFRKTISSKTVQRFYFTNAATVRPFNIAIAGAQMKLVGGDGGRYERETLVDSVLVAPSERAIVDVYFPQAGTYALEHRIPGGVTHALGVVTAEGEGGGVASESFGVLRENASEIAEFNTLRSYLSEAPRKQLRLTLSMDMNAIMGHMGSMGAGGHAHGGASDMSGHAHAGGDTSGSMGGMAGMHAPVPIEWEDTMGDMNTFSTSKTVKWIMRDEETLKENMDINWVFKKGEYVKIRIVNDPTSGHPMHHPVHFHGNRFAVLAVNDIPSDNMVWKDTALLKTGDTMDILLETTNLGKWMAHCHIAEHMHSGMMIGYTVE
jgi:suppressor of ftsI